MRILNSTSDPCIARVKSLVKLMAKHCPSSLVPPWQILQTNTREFYIRTIGVPNKKLLRSHIWFKHKHSPALFESLLKIIIFLFVFCNGSFLTTSDVSENSCSVLCKKKKKNSCFVCVWGHTWIEFLVSHVNLVQIGHLNWA